MTARYEKPIKAKLSDLQTSDLFAFTIKELVIFNRIPYIPVPDTFVIAVGDITKGDRKFLAYLTRGETRSISYTAITQEMSEEIILLRFIENKDKT